jgi:hypothetical protein
MPNNGNSFDIPKGIEEVNVDEMFSFEAGEKLKD